MLLTRCYCCNEKRNIYNIYKRKLKLYGNKIKEHNNTVYIIVQEREIG